MNHFRTPLAVLSPGPGRGLLGPASWAAARLAGNLCAMNRVPLALMVPAECSPSPESVGVLRAELASLGVRTKLIEATGDPGTEAEELARADHVFVPRGWQPREPVAGPLWSVGPFSPRRVRRVVVAHDLEPAGCRAMRLGAALADWSRAELHAVHAWQLPLEAQLERGRVRDPDPVARHLRGLRRSLRTDLAAAGAPAAPFHLLRTTPVDALTSAVAELAPDVLVVGRTARGALAGRMAATRGRLEAQLPCTLLFAPSAPSSSGSEPLAVGALSA